MKSAWEIIFEIYKKSSLAEELCRWADGSFSGKIVEDFRDVQKQVEKGRFGESMGSGNSTSHGESGSPEETEVEETY